ncbi:Helix-turn-helix domain-containing protein [Arachidicoccus rhizosphaerae]|jgi:DNA-binding response OmpR family regulator|uniref:Helix-turn-helix domain-containing protein n=1 Tax=Arachidicoccus rhizosphaerae TaxID=551991 RepID=A0A1H4AKP9_9BACT|nr:response regulator [Arachidicoccus rhizosphaerae]SEA36495.1 Helix-turn-helix domain-containing protein [Arachidicoccus rhizosphaerae]
MQEPIDNINNVSIANIHKQTILIVDDNQEILEFLADDLEDIYNVVTATSVKKALPCFEMEMIALVISDILMPETDGLAFCKMIKTNMELSHIPVILLTAKNGIPAQIEGLEHGADAYIEKPFSPEYLQVQIANLLSNRSRLRSYFSSFPLATIHSMAHNSADEEFLSKLHQVIVQHLDDPKLDVDQLSNKLYISKPTLYRKIKSITDMTPGELITVTRLKKSAEYLSEQKYSILEVSVMVGFNSATHFGRCFQKQFGMSPSKFLSKNPVE